MDLLRSNKFCTMYIFLIDIMSLEKSLFLVGLSSGNRVSELSAIDMMICSLLGLVPMGNYVSQ